MRKITLLLSLMVVFGFMTTNAQEQLKNGSFESWAEDVPTDWKTYAAGNTTLTEETTIVSDGTKAVKIDATADGSKSKKLIQQVALTAGKTYKLSINYYIVTGDGTDARVWCTFLNAENKKFSPEEMEATGYKKALQGPDNKYFTGENGVWGTYTTEFVCPANATGISYEVRTYSSATVIWDNLSLMMMGENTDPSLLVSPSSLTFEEKLNATTSTIQTVTVTAANLSEVPTYAISGTDATMFSVENANLTTVGGTIDVGFNPTAIGTKTATLTITAGTLSETVALNATVTEDGGSTPTGAVSYINEDFQTATAGKVLPNGWTSEIQKGDRAWEVKDYKGAKHVQMNSHKGTKDTYETTLVSPLVDFNKVDKTITSSFDWKPAFANGATLNVFVRNESGEVVKELGTISATEPATGYGKFSTKTLDLTGVTVKGHLVFLYIGSKTATTTYQLDNIKIGNVSSGVKTPMLNLNIYTTNGAIHFQATTGEKIEVYTITGQQVVVKTALNGKNTISLNNGMYLVKVGNRIGKVIL